ncbi:hypothetical protein COR50_12335 [Chitinophaga caeni]|uniref:Uncharacterized protein n=1 Tax=Chitinophaga caeni TaxID=2029983 RepID=A0A291QV23_9BACT|nr:hypothetical protein [Chitinophaga caeni]ATL47889.1 hypothetical protein COR50_12335 [Chitinophaga caeni]
MLALLKRLRSFAYNSYTTAEQRALKSYMFLGANAYELAKAKLLFDYIFFVLLTSITIFILVIARQDYYNLINCSFFTAIFFGCFISLHIGKKLVHIGMLTAYNTVLYTVAASIINNLDIGPMFTVPMLLGILLAHITNPGKHTFILVGIVFLYLSAVSYAEFKGISLNLTRLEDSQVINNARPFFSAVYILLLLRVFGLHYRDVIILSQQESTEHQKQFSALVNQNLIKQFIIVKGLSRSGKSKYLDGTMELDECFTEIERQCDSAIQYLDHQGYDDPGHNQHTS